MPAASQRTQAPPPRLTPEGSRAGDQRSGWRPHPCLPPHHPQVGEEQRGARDRMRGAAQLTMSGRPSSGAA